MKQFFTTLLAVLVGGVILSFLPLLLFIITVSAIGAASSSSSTTIESGSVLTLDLSNPIVDRDLTAPMTLLSNSLQGNGRSRNLYDITAKIYDAAEDSRIAALLIQGDEANCDMAALAELRRAVQYFKETSSKPVVFYSNSATTGSLYVGSVADSVFVSPTGGVEVKGMTTQRTYFLKLAEKLGIHFDVIKHGRYKSAVEPFYRTDMSPEDREQTQRFIDVLWADLRDSIAASRKIPAESIDTYVDEMGYLRHADRAVETGLIDRTLYSDKLLETITAMVKADKTVKTVSMQDYSQISLEKDIDKIAVVYALGEIADGDKDSDTETIYGDDLVKTLRKVREDKEVKAVVFRVNSPGGSAAASDNIWREIDLISSEKPVVVSMGAYAASGGYYISCAADYIYSEPTTLTGSIGVYGFIPNVEQMLKNGEVSTEVISSNKNPIELGVKALPSTAIGALTENVEETYATFVNKVAEGRQMTYAAVDSIASGRVWAGADAVKIGLVDALGGMDDALDMAAELASLEDYDVIPYPQADDSPFAVILDMGANAKAAVGKLIFGSEYKQFEQMRQLLEEPRAEVKAVTDVEYNF